MRFPGGWALMSIPDSSTFSSSSSTSSALPPPNSVVNISWKASDIWLYVVRNICSLRVLISAMTSVRSFFAFIRSAMFLL